MLTDPTGELAGQIAIVAYIALEGYSIYQDFEDGREDGRWQCENLVKKLRQLRELPPDDLRRFELQADIDVNTVDAFKRSIAGPVSNTPGTAGSIGKDIGKDVKKLKFPLPIKGLGSLLWGELVKKWGRRVGMKECGCER